MLLAIAALASVADPAPGCRSWGASVHCELAPPIRQALPAPARIEPVKVVVADRGKRAAAPQPIRQLVRVVPAKPSAPTTAEIARHIESLVAIEDCTGARTFARSIGAADLAQRTFEACIGIGKAPPAEMAGHDPVGASMLAAAQ